MQKKRNLSIVVLLLMFSLDLSGQSKPMYRYSMENMRVINSRFSELSLFPNSDSTYMLVSDRGGKDRYNKWTGNSPYNIYSINRSNWTEIKIMGGLNTKFSDGPLCLKSDNELIVTQTDKRGSAHPGTGIMIYQLNLALATFENGQWTSSTINEFSSKDHSYAHPTMNKNGDMLIFASNMEGGFGGNDLYVSYLIKNKWSEPENLGPRINTRGDETFPFLHADGSLYFSSRGHAGYGGDDIFVSRKDGKKWAEPLNLGEPVNSAAHEFGIYFNDNMDRGFVSSNRLGGRGGDDIYAIFVDKIYDNQYVSKDKEGYPSEANSYVEVKKEAIEEVKPEIKTEVAVNKIDETVESVEQEPEMKTEEVFTEKLVVEELEKEGRRKTRNKEVEADPEIEVAPIVVHSTDQVEYGSENELSVLDTEIIEVDFKQEETAVKKEATVEEKKRYDDLEPRAVIRNEVKPIEVEINDQGLAFNEEDESYTEAAIAEVIEPEIEVKEKIVTNKVVEKKADIATIELTSQKEMVLMEHYMKSSDLMNVYFGMNSYKVDAKGEKILKELAEVMTEYQHPVLELHAHADATGDHDINIKLSELRARAVIQYLGKQGIDIDRMAYLAYGESDLYMAQNADISLNRRVEFRLKDYNHQFDNEEGRVRIEGFSYKQLPMLEERKYFVQMAALSDMRTFSTYKLKEYGAALCYYQGGLYKYILGPFDTMEEATVNLEKVRLNYSDAFIFKNE